MHALAAKAVIHLLLSGLGKDLLKVLAGFALLVLLALVFVVATIGALVQSITPRGPGMGGTAAQPLGPVYQAGTGNLVPGGGRHPHGLRLATIRDLGFGPSDATRIERLIAAIRPSSPLVGHGARILRLGQQFGVDPLLIALWQPESQMATVGLNSPGNGGNLIWEAAAPYAARWGCTPGPSSLGHHWAHCPSVEAGLGIWFQYVGTSPVYAGAANLSEFVNIYNPCSDPENARNGFPCGDVYGVLILDLLRTHAGPPVASTPPPTGTCPPLSPLRHAAANLDLPAGVPEIVGTVLGGRSFPITHGWGPSEYAGEPSWLGYPDFHAGIDIGTPVGTPVFAPAAGVVVTGAGSGVIVELRRPTGYIWRFQHLSEQVAAGPVQEGQLIAYTGNTGYSDGPHLHLELRDPSGGYVAPEHWGCVGIHS